MHSCANTGRVRVRRLDPTVDLHPREICQDRGQSRYNWSGAVEMRSRERCFYSLGDDEPIDALATASSVVVGHYPPMSRDCRSRKSAKIIGAYNWDFTRKNKFRARATFFSSLVSVHAILLG